MATPTSASSSTTNARWGRSGEPGSAFNGLSNRSGRGGRGRGAPRGGRGGGRTTTSHREPKHDDNNKQNPKSDNSQHISSSIEKPPSSAPTPAPPSEPSSISSTSSKPKPQSRRLSRAVPPDINTQSLHAVATSAPASAKPSNRRQRSQANKPVPTKINPPAPNDSLLRPNKPRLAQVPHTAPIKDTPPHLSQKTGIRNDIDALVERVRAVAMDNRPSTPGSHSHIDWAGDDDDTLPDLDDWGVTTAAFSSSKSDVISPLIVGGLKSLPDIAGNSFPSSPLKQSSLITGTQQQQEPQTVLPSQVTPLDSSKAEAKSTKPKGPTETAEPEVNPSTSVKTSTAPQGSRSRKPLHPSLPAKPATVLPVSQPRGRAGATPMRKYPKSPVSASKDSFGSKSSKTEQSPECHTTSAALDEEAKGNASVEAVAVSASNEKTPTAPEATKVLDSTVPTLEVQPAKESPQDKPKADVKAEDDDYWSREGLSASIHAPKAISDSVSAPATVSTYPDLPSERPLTHSRTQTVGRPFPRPSHNDYVPRFTRSGNSTPRSIFDGQQHVRTQSTPPAGVMSNQPRAHRPVITGDAISRLARTIGKTGISNAANAKVQPVGSPGH